MSDPEPKRARKPKWRRRLWRAAWISSLLALALYLSREWTVHPLLTRAAGPLGRLANVEVEVDDISGTWFGGLQIEGLKAQPTEGDAWAVDVQRASVAWNVLGLVRGHHDWLESIEADGVRVEVRPSGPSESSDEVTAWPSAPTWLPQVTLTDVDVIVHEATGTRLEIVDFQAASTRDAQGKWALDAGAQSIGRVTPEGILGSKVEFALTYENQWVDLEHVDLDGRPWVSASHIDLGGLADRRLEVELEATGPSERTTLRMVLDGERLSADLEIDALDLTLVESWVPGILPEDTEGLFDVRMQMETQLSEPLAGTGSVRVDAVGIRTFGRTIDEVRVRGTLEDQVATLGVLDVLAGATTIEARNLSAPISFESPIPDEEAFTGTFHLKSTDVDVLVRGDASTGTAPEHSLDIEGDFHEGALRLLRGELVTSGARLEIVGAKVQRASEDGSVAWPIDLDAVAKAEDLGPLGRLFGFEDWSGSLQGSVILEGSVLHPMGLTDLKGTAVRVAGLDLGDLTLLALSTPEGVTVKPSGFDGGLGIGQLSGKWDFATQSFEAATLSLAIEAEEQLRPWIIPGGRIQIDGTFDGPWRTPNGHIDGQVSGLTIGETPLSDVSWNIRAADGTWSIEQLVARSDDAVGLELQEPTTIVWTGERRAIEGLVLEGPSGRIEANGEFLGDDASFAVELKDIEPMPFLESVLPTGVVIGDLSAHLRSARKGATWMHVLDGTVLVFDGSSGAEDLRAAEPVVVSWDGSLDAAGVHLKELVAEYHGDQLARLEGHLPYAPGAANPWLDGNLTLVASGQVPAPLQVALPLHATIGTSIAAPSSFELDLSGTWRELRGRIDVDVEGLVISTPDVTTGDLVSPGRVALRGQFGESGLAIETLHVDLPNRTTLDLTGSIGLPQDVTAWTADDFAPLETALDAQGQIHAPDLTFVAGLDPGIQRSAGSIDVTFDLAGTLGEPSGLGSLTLNDALFKARGAPIIDGIGGTCDFLDGVFTLNDVTARLGAAPVTARGTVDGSGAQPVFDLKIDGTNVLLVRDANLRMRADLNLALVGPLDAMSATGKIGLRNSRVTQSIDLLGVLEGGSGFKSQQVGLLIAPFKTGPLADLRFDVQVDTVEPVDLIGNLMKGSAKASLHLTGTGRGIHPDGAVFMQSTILSLPGGSLTLTGGSVRFSKSNPLFPTLDIYGESRMIGYDVNCHITGSTADPVVELSSSPPLPQDDILILLLTGRLPSQSSGRQAAEALTIYLAKDALRAFFSDGSLDQDESFIDRFEYESGREISDKGTVSLEARFRVADGVIDERDAIYIVAERDRFEDFNMGLRFTLRLR